MYDAFCLISIFSHCVTSSRWSATSQGLCVFEFFSDHYHVGQTRNWKRFRRYLSLRLRILLFARVAGGLNKI